MLLWVRSSFVMDDMYNPLAVIKDREDLTLSQSLRGTAGLSWKIIKGLNYHSELTLTRGNTQNKKLERSYLLPALTRGNYLNSDGTHIYSGGC